MKLSIGKKNKEQLKENDDKYKKEINQKEQEFKMLQLSYELKEEYQTRTNKYELVFERMKFNDDIRDKLNYNPIHLHNDFLIHNSLLDIPTNRKFQTIL